ncbi:cell division protein FtsZ [uncultured Porticoccus sp.]|uniref:cell division protein FtsZ n=1 Tax=uncultured Porticoccus sp. TaxID=1256050 RepID=UPI00261C94AD|nr:cell division protein FtsZ [uncultured Porticoccus sp.]
MFQIVDSAPDSAEIKVIGVGGGGGNAVRHMMSSCVDGVEFICANTDAQALKDLGHATILQLGNGLTKGLGAGANPEVGRHAAMEDRERIADVLQGADMVFITAGMGGGTGTGAAPIVADVARELGILTVAVVTRPFVFEGRKRMAIAEEGLKELKDRVDSLITVPNEKLLQVLGKTTSLLEAFKAANDVLLGAVQGIADLIIRPGMINVDFADVRTVMSEMGQAMMGTGEATGEDRARIAAETAIHSPLLEDINLQGARGILVNITAGPDLSLGEFSDVGDTVEAFASDNATVVVGTVIDPEMGDRLRVTVVATGLGQPALERKAPSKVVDNGHVAPIHMRKSSGETDYDALEKPTVIRRGSSGGEAVARKLDARADADMDYLDIPAFLRRQAD